MQIHITETETVTRWGDVEVPDDFNIEDAEALKDLIKSKEYWFVDSSEDYQINAQINAEVVETADV